MTRVPRKLICVATFLACALMFSSSAEIILAQTMTQTQSQSEDFRRQPPQPLPIRPLNIPKPFETQLPNGLQIVLVEDHRLPLASFRLVFRTGNASDPGDLRGLTGMMSGLLTEGTE